MPRPVLPSVSNLPRLNETWFVAINRLRTWIAPPREKPYRPFLVSVLNSEVGTIRGSQIFPMMPTPPQVYDTLSKAMHHPVPLGGSRGVPRLVLLADSALANALTDLFLRAKLEIAVGEGVPPPEADEAIREFERMTNKMDEPPGMLSVNGVTVELAGSVFAAAADFYRAAPWIKLSNSQVIALKHPAETDYRYAIVMGQGGIEYGLAVYLTWKDVIHIFTTDDNPEEAIPASGGQSLMFNPITMMPFDDLDAMEQNGWQVAGDEAYPFVVTFKRPDQVLRPSYQDLMWLEAALRAIPILARDYFKSDGRGDYLAFDARVTVPTHSGEIQMAVKYPAGEIPFAEQPPQDLRWGEPGEDEADEADDAPFFDRRSMEGMMRGKLRELGMPEETRDADLNRAQELMYRAFESDNPAKRITLAHDALAISENCADAYVLLAEEEADTVSRALELYQQGVSAGERALGDQFEEYVGHFWGVMETRPYMRARLGLANMLNRMNRRDEALVHYREMLRLNPNDNQGVRDIILDLLLQLQQDDEAHELLKQYKDDWTAVWLYTRALLLFRIDGASARSNKALADALEENPFAPAYLTGHKRVPNRLPEMIGWGEESEAIAYAADHLNHWRVTPGAVEWLAEQRQTRRKPAHRPTPRRRKRSGLHR